MMKRILSAVFFLISISVHAQVKVGGDSMIVDYANPKQYVIGAIQVVPASKFLDDNVLVTISGLNTGDTLDIPGDRISKAVENLWKQGLFSDVKIVVNRTVGQLIFLELWLTEKPRLSFQ
jgi:outer membrane protein insertion porin family